MRLALGILVATMLSLVIPSAAATYRVGVGTAQAPGGGDEWEVDVLRLNGSLVDVMLGKPAPAPRPRRGA